MRKNQIVHYYCEGENEERLLKVLKTELGVIVPGKIEKYNAVDRRFTEARLRLLRPRTTVVLVFDTDTENTDILKENIRRLERHNHVEHVILVPQVTNLQEELKIACGLKDIKELLGTKGEEEFKKEFNRVSNLKDKLMKKGFDIMKLWSQKPTGVFREFRNDSEQIKLK